jgi:AraC-like DNA-binding protein
MMLNRPAITFAPCIAHVTSHHTPPPAVASPPREHTTWESLARAASFRATILARHCGVSLRTLERHFIKHYQITVTEFLRKLRLNLAYTRLKNGERIKSIAYDLAYKQLSHFSRDFKNYFGVPPRTIQPACVSLWRGIGFETTHQYKLPFHE